VLEKAQTKLDEAKHAASEVAEAAKEKASALGEPQAKRLITSRDARKMFTVRVALLRRGSAMRCSRGTGLARSSWRWLCENILWPWRSVSLPQAPSLVCSRLARGLKMSLWAKNLISF
jgi:hypothetical protein